MFYRLKCKIAGKVADILFSMSPESAELDPEVEYRGVRAGGRLVCDEDGHISFEVDAAAQKAVREYLGEKAMAEAAKSDAPAEAVCAAVGDGYGPPLPGDSNAPQAPQPLMDEECGADGEGIDLGDVRGL